MNIPARLITGLFAIPLSMPLLAHAQDAEQMPPPQQQALMMKTPSWKGSMMFNEGQLNFIYSGLVERSQTGGLGGLPSTATDLPATTIIDGNNVPQQRVTAFAPAYHLQSIVYHGPDEWTIWINGKRNRSGTKRHDNLEIISVDKDRVVFVWHDPQFNEMLPFWKEKFAPSTPNGLVRFDPPAKQDYQWEHISEDNLIQLDNTHWAVRFELTSNQSFVSHELSIAEGKAEGKNISFFPNRANAPDFASATELTSGATETNNDMQPTPPNDHSEKEEEGMKQLFGNVGVRKQQIKDNLQGF